MTPKVS